MIEPADYGRWRKSRLGSLTEFIEQRAISRFCGNLSRLRVLDLGCGDGTYAILASEEGAIAVGLDISPEMLRTARIRAAAEAAQVIWCEASISALPFAPDAFDLVIAVTVLCVSNDPRPAIKEAARVLRPSGSLVIGELGKYSLWALSRRIRGWLGSRTWGRARFWSAQEIQRAIEAAGLRVGRAQGCVYYPPVGAWRFRVVYLAVTPPIQRATRAHRKRWRTIGVPATSHCGSTPRRPGLSRRRSRFPQPQNPPTRMPPLAANNFVRRVLEELVRLHLEDCHA